MSFFFTPEDIDILVKGHFVPAFRHDNVNVFISPHSTGKALVFHVKELSQRQYNSERTIYGKAIRLMIFLNEYHSLLRQLKRYELNKVIVSDALDIEKANKSNTAVLDTPFIEEFLTQLITLRKAGGTIAEDAIKILIGS